MEADEKYLTSRQEARHVAWLAERKECAYCNNHFLPESGFHVSSGEFICNGCKAIALQRGVIALCIDCSDYFYASNRDVNPISCPNCKEKTEIAVRSVVLG